MNPYSLLKPTPDPNRKSGKRLYAGADLSRLTSDWAPTSSSADAEIITSLRVLRNRSRQLIRDNEYACNAKRQVEQNVVGTGIGLQALVKNQRGALIESVNDQIEEAWQDWWMEPSAVHTAGIMSGPEIERFVVGNLFESGEAFIRLVRRPFGDSEIPLSLELLESDRVMDQWTQQTAPNGNLIRMGIEMDQWHRPTAYWCWPVHPGDWQFSTFAPSAFIRVPADEILHIFIVERVPQSRGVPWLHAAMSRLNNMRGYEQAEIVSARMAAAIMGFITSPELQTPDDVEDDKRVTDMEPGQIRHLLPGESFTGWDPGKGPNTVMDPFMRLMLRGVAAGVGISYESLSRDYQHANYSGSRTAQLEDRDLWRLLQSFIAGRFRRPLHREFLNAAVLANELKIPDFYSNEKKYSRAHFKPRGWAWIDPQKEVAAYNIAVRSGFMTVGDVIAQTNGGKDAEDVLKSRRDELDEMAELDLVFDTDPAQVNQKGIAQPNTAPQEQVDEPASAGEQAGQPGEDDNNNDDSKPAAQSQPTSAAAAQPAKALPAPELVKPTTAKPKRKKAA